MKSYLFMVLGLLLTTALASAQDPNQPRKGQGYLFFAPGGVTEHGHSESLLQFGIGGEAVFYKGLGVGAEGGYLFSPRYSGSGAFLASLNVLYQFPGKGSSMKIVPFFTGGVSGVIGSGGGGGGFNFGGGVTYWMRRRMGIRFEFRDHIPKSAPSAHLWQTRIGFAF